MKKFAIIGRFGLIAVIIGWTGCSDVSVSNDSAQNIEGAFGLKLGEVYEKEVDENYAAAFTPSNSVKPFTFYALVVVPSTKKICFITASAEFDDDDEAKRQKEVLKRVIEKKYNAKFQYGLSNSFIHEKYVQAIEKVRTKEMSQRGTAAEQARQDTTVPEGENDDFYSLLRERSRNRMGNRAIPHLKKGGRVITMFSSSQRVITLSYGDENLMRSVIEEEKRKKEEKEESKINVEGL